MEELGREGNPGWEVFAKIKVIEENGEKKVLVRGQPYMVWRSMDQEAQRVAIVGLYKSGIGDQEELANAFGMHIKSIYNYVNTFEEVGMQGLLGERSGPKESWKLTPEVRRQIILAVIRNSIKGYREIQEELKSRWGIKVSVESIRQVLIENGFIEERIKSEGLWEQMDIFNETEDKQLELEDLKERRENKELSLIEEGGEKEREDSKAEIVNQKKGLRYYSTAEREYLEHLEEGEYSVYGGGFLLVPFMQRYHFLPIMRQTINMETYEGYSLDQLSLTLFYYDLFKFESIENFKSVYSEEFGMLIGKLKSPSIFTLRRFLHKVRKLKTGDKLIEEFAKEYLSSGLAKYGVLYIDGHFLPYYGIREITLGWNTIREKAMKGSYNFLGNDEKFNPLIFLVRPSSEDLLEKIPEMIRIIKKIGKEAGLDTGELTVIFDREGYSAELFRLLDDLEGEKIKFITWAKYSDKWVNEIENGKFKDTVEVTYEIQEKEEILYCEIDRQMNKYGKIRAIAIETGTQKKRSVIYTNDWDREAGKIIQLICRRWGQENSIKTLKLKHLIDYHPGYVSEELEEQPMVENPELEELKRRRAALVSQLHGIELKFVEKILNKREDEISLKQIKESEIKTFADIAAIKSQITLMNEDIERCPKELKFDEANDKRLMELDYEKKRFLDCIKVFACHMEKKMCEILIKYYDTEKEILPLLHMIINRGTHVRLVQGKLIVRLRRFQDREVNYAARHLCEELNQIKPVTLDRFRFPIYYEVARGTEKDF